MLQAALETIVCWLEEKKVPYMVFGGIANSLYGNPRQTFDIDIKISIENPEEVKGFVRAIQEVAAILPSDPETFIDETNVLPVSIDNVRVDIVFARLPFEKKAIERSIVRQFISFPLRVCRVEDFILQKVISTRQKDWDDIVTVATLQKETIDWNYLLKYCRELGEFLDDSEIARKIERLR
jgi:hypothetical protein